MKKPAPWRFILFVSVLVATGGVAAFLWTPVRGIILGFDLAAMVFLLSCLPLLNDTASQMRKHAEVNDANRPVLLAISVTVSIVILATVGAEVAQSRRPQIGSVLLVVATLTLAWLFANVIYALHYAHLFYSRTKDSKGDARGIEFPGTKEPSYWDFIYFAFTLGMTFQTSDCDITSQSIRRVTTGHCLAAFVFNIGVLAFTINLLGSS